MAREGWGGGGAELVIMKSCVNDSQVRLYNWLGSLLGSRIVARLG